MAFDFNQYLSLDEQLQVARDVVRGKATDLFRLRLTNDPSSASREQQLQEDIVAAEAHIKQVEEAKEKQEPAPAPEPAVSFIPNDQRPESGPLAVTPPDTRPNMKPVVEQPAPVPKISPPASIPPAPGVPDKPAKKK